VKRINVGAEQATSLTTGANPGHGHQARARGVNALTFCTRTVLRHVISMQQIALKIYDHRVEHAEAI